MAGIVGFIQSGWRALAGVGVDITDSAGGACAITRGAGYTAAIKEGTAVGTFTGSFRLRPCAREGCGATWRLDVGAVNALLAIDGTVVV